MKHNRMSTRFACTILACALALGAVSPVSYAYAEEDGALSAYAYPTPTSSYIYSSRVPETEPGGSFESAINLIPQIGSDEASSFVVTLKNGVFDKDIVTKAKYSDGMMTYEQVMDGIEKRTEGISSSAQRRSAEINVLSSAMGVITDILPYSLEYISENQIRVNVVPLPNDAANVYDYVCIGKPKIYLPIYGTADGKGNVSAELDFEGTTFFPMDEYSVYIARIKGSELESSCGRFNTAAPTLKTAAGEEFTKDITIVPLNGIGLNESITIEIENGTFQNDIAEKAVYTDGIYSYDEFIRMLNDRIAGNNITENILNRGIRDSLQITMRNYTNELPYKLSYIDPTHIKVELAPLPNAAANTADYVCSGKPYFKLPIYAVAGSGEVKLNITSELSDFYQQGLVIANAAGSTDHVNYVSPQYIDEVSEGTAFKNYVRLFPYNGDTNGGSFTVTLRNAAFDKDIADKAAYTDGSMSYDEVMQALGTSKNTQKIRDTLISAMDKTTNHLPYKIEYLNENQIRVYVVPIDANSVNASSGICDGFASVNLPIFGTADGKGNVTAEFSFDDTTLFPTIGCSVVLAYTKNDSSADSYAASRAYTAGSSKKVESGDSIEHYIFMKPFNEVPSGASLVLSIENAEFDPDIASKSRYDGIYDYDSVIERINVYTGGFESKREYKYAVRNSLTSAMGPYTSVLPYKTEYIDKNHIKVYIAPITDDLINMFSISNNMPYYSIPIFANNVSGTVKISIDSDLAEFRTDGLIIASTGEPALPYGAAGAGESITAADSAMILQKVLNNSYRMPIEAVTDNYLKYLDVNADGALTAADSAIVLQKVLNSSFVMPVEK